jgi:uncharacterized RDD family membrane protein YckC
VETEERQEAHDRLERDYLAGKLSADEYTQLRRALHEEAISGVAPHEPVLASWGGRAAALLLDTFVLVIVIVVTAVASIALTGPVGDSASALVGLELLLLPGLYHWLMTGARGQTLGKMAVGVKVVRAADEARVGYLRALGRVVSIWLLGLFLLPLLLAYLWPIWDRRNQTLYDKMAGTIVVRTA